MKMKRIMLAYDGSGAAEDATGWAADLARRLGGGLEIVTVGEMQIGDIGALVPVLSPEEAEALVGRAVKRARAHGVEPTTHLLWGHPGEEICDHARRTKADLIVLGHRGRGGLESLLLGSVAKCVIDQAPCSVYVVR